MSFALDLDRFARKTNAKADAVVRKIVLDIGTSLVFKSPVGDTTHWKHPAPPGYVGGRFRANWQYGNELPTSTLAAIDPSGAATVGKLFSSVQIKAAGKLHFLVNRLPYGPALEEGHSRQAPHGMVGLTVIEFQPIVERAAIEINLLYQGL
jgi:hypothetical protein